MKQDNKAQGKKPFFAKLLEKQELEQVTGGINITNKLIDNVDQTHKYPSDSDEHHAASEGTLKYPSDSDEREAI